MITNLKNIPLVLAVWAVHDEYDYIKEENYISATGLMKPLRHIVLPRRVPSECRVVEDVDDFVSRALGHTIHDGIEKSWVKGYRTNLAKLGYPEKMINRVIINPEPQDLKPDSIPIYLEQREIRKIIVDGVEYKVGGKFDCVADGILHDTKSTGTYGYMVGGRDEDYILQGSIYRWLNPGKITANIIRICFVFTDWQKALARQNPNYPQSRVVAKEYTLMSPEETEQWIRNKIRQVVKYNNVPEPEVPECTDDELWIAPPKFKYYANAANTSGRSSKNFDSREEALDYWHKDKGGKGVVLTVQGAPKRCDYCAAAPICSQREKFNHDRS